MGVYEGACVLKWSGRWSTRRGPKTGVHSPVHTHGLQPGGAFKRVQPSESLNVQASGVVRAHSQKIMRGAGHTGLHTYSIYTQGSCRGKGAEGV